MTWKIYRPDEKKPKKKYWKFAIELSVNDNTKILQLYSFPLFLSMSEKNCGIYWLDSYNLLTSKNGLKSSKQLKIIFPFMSVLNTLNTLNINNVRVSWHFQNVIHNLQTRLSQFTDQEKVWDGTNNANRTCHI